VSSWLSLFQSAPGGEAGGNADAETVVTDPFGFNPPPAVRPGGTLGSWLPRCHSECFNPPPAVRPGGTRCGAGHKPAITRFQSAPGGEAGGNARRAQRWPEQPQFQSAPGGEAGGNHLRPIPPRNGYGFNPPPAVRPGGTFGFTITRGRNQVSIRPRR